MRKIAFFLFALLLFGCTGDNDTPGDSGHSTSSVASYSSGDTLIAMQEAKISSDPGRPDWIHDLEAGDTVRVVGKENIEGEISLRVHHDGVKGWIGENYDFSGPDYYRSLRENGLDLVVLSQIFSKNEGNEISLHNYVSNISRFEGIEAIHFTWKLFGKDGNPASTDKHSGNTIQATAKGVYGTEIKPGQSTYPGFDIGYSPEASCVELHKIKLEFANGSTSTYSKKSLRDITKQAEDVRLAGECS